MSLGPAPAAQACLSSVNRGSEATRGSGFKPGQGHDSIHPPICPVAQHRRRKAPRQGAHRCAMSRMRVSGTLCVNWSVKDGSRLCGQQGGTEGVTGWGRRGWWTVQEATWPATQPRMLQRALRCLAQCTVLTPRLPGRPTCLQSAADQRRDGGLRALLTNHPLQRPAWRAKEIEWEDTRASLLCEANALGSLSAGLASHQPGQVEPCRPVIFRPSNSVCLAGSGPQPCSPEDHAGQLGVSVGPVVPTALHTLDSAGGQPLHGM